MLEVINRNTEAHLCNQADGRCEVKKRKKSLSPLDLSENNHGAQNRYVSNSSEKKLSKYSSMLFEFDQIWMVRALPSAVV